LTVKNGVNHTYLNETKRKTSSVDTDSTLHKANDEYLNWLLVTGV